jgi:hypothetical protein
MAKKRIYELLNKAVLTVTDLFMIDKSGDANATNVSGQQIVDLVQDNTDFTDLQDVPTDYTGDGGKYVMVALTEDGLEFTTISFDNVANGTLTGNRVVTFNDNTLTFLGSKTNLIPASAAAGDITFGVRDFDDTTYNFYVSGNGSVLGVGGFCDLNYDTGVQVNFLRTNTWNDAASTVNLVTWNFGGDGFFKIYKPTNVLSPSASALDTAFAVRNNTDTGNLVQIKGNGDAVFNAPNGVEMSYVRANFWNTRNDAIALMTYDLEGLGEMNHNRRSIFQRETEVRLQTATTANFRIKNFNNTLVCFNVTENGKVSMPLIPTSAAGLSAGDVWNHNGTLKIV